MPQLAPKALKNRSAKAWQAKGLWRGLQSEVYKYALPMRNLYDDRAPAAGSAKNGDDKMAGVYDSTAITSTIAFANRIQSDLIPPFEQWCDLEPGPFMPDQYRDQAARELQSAQKKGFALIHTSNFDLQANEFLLDMAGGQAALLMHEDNSMDKPVRFEAVPSATVATDEGPDGSVDGKFRKFEVAARNLKRQWHDILEERFPTELQTLVNDPERHDEPVKIDEVTYWDDDDELWRYEVIYTASEGKQEEDIIRLVEREETTDPWVVARWIKVSGESQGRGPLHFALPDIKTANAVVALILQNASFAVSGAFVGADDGVLNPSMVVIKPGMVIAAKRPENLRPLEWGGRFDVAQLVLEDMRANIRRILFDERLPPMDASVRSATEIVERIKQLQADVGAPFGRLMSEFLQPVWVRLLDIMRKKGLVKMPIKINGLTVRIKVTSPLAKQQAMKELELAMLWIQLLQQVAPELLMLNVNVEDLGEWMADRMRIDRTIVRSRQDRQKMQRMSGAAMAQQMQQQQGLTPQGVQAAPAGRPSGPPALQIAA